MPRLSVTEGSTDPDGRSVAHIETLHAPKLYADWQIDLAVAIAASLGRGRFVLVQPPLR
jgi:hypothetical protein